MRDTHTSERISFIYLLFFLRANIVLMVGQSEYSHFTVLPI